MRKMISLLLILTLGIGQLLGCGTNQRVYMEEEKGSISLSAAEEQNADSEEFTDIRELTWEEAIRQRALGKYTPAALLTSGEKEVNIEQGQFFYGAFMLSLPEGVSAAVQYLSSGEQVVELYGLEAYHEEVGEVAPILGFSYFDAKYENKETLLTALLKYFSGSEAVSLYADDEKKEYSYKITQYPWSYYVFVRETEVYVVETPASEENFSFAWLLEEGRAGWGDGAEEAVFTGQGSGSAYRFVLLGTESGFLLSGKDRRVDLYLEGYYENPYQIIQDSGYWGNLEAMDMNFDGYSDLALYETYYLWNAGQKEYVAAQTEVIGLDFDDVQFFSETNTLWNGSEEYDEDTWRKKAEVENLWQWEGDALVKKRECRTEIEETGMRIWAYEGSRDNLLFDEFIPKESEKESKKKMQTLYERFYEGYVPKEAYALAHSRPAETDCIPQELVNNLIFALEEGRESQELEGLWNRRELSHKEVIQLARGNIDIRKEILDAQAMGGFRMLEADLDNDGLSDILSQTYYGGTGGFTDYVFFQGQEDGSFKETERLGSVLQDFDIIEYQGKNYFYQVEFDYGKKVDAGLIICCFQNGRLTEEVTLWKELEDYELQVLECASLEYEGLVDDMLQKACDAQEKIREYETIVGTAEKIKEGEEWSFSCDLDNDGMAEDYNKGIWSSSNMWTQDCIIFNGEEDAGIDMVCEAMESQDWQPIMMWADVYAGKSIIHTAYYTNTLYDFKMVGYMVSEKEYREVYQLLGTAGEYVDCVRRGIYFPVDNRE